MDDAQGNISRRGLVAAEQAGRGGDRVLGHLTPGELVVPKSCQTPELMALFAKVAHGAGLDPNRFIVGSPEASKNPRTGLEEFLEGESGGVGDTGGNTGSAGASGGGSNSNGAGPMGGENAAHGANQFSTTDRDAAYGGGWSDSSGGIDGWLSDKVSQAFAAPTGRSLGVLGTGIGMVGGPVGMAMAAGPAVAETLGNAITGGIQDAFGVTADAPPGTVDYSYGDAGTGGSTKTDTREFVPEIRKRRGLLTRAS
ncbi:hypothetical protein CRT60_21770 [Azospirillum palustre]|uniref:Uncharacterized protein n=1 Tax=Azospirillum palustre TaxID=2044885 RepID=A0A2B8BEB6_9PROT|nr:hypothetical protein [Azospirillum palustre]PGH55883.1 hypothetical protein CRT60_21770 [Azospirillum palustre]